MGTIGQLAQQLLNLEPQKNPARLAFYHYLKNYLPLDEEFNPDVLSGFYDRAMSLQYWQSNEALSGFNERTPSAQNWRSNKQILNETIRDDLTMIHSRYPTSFDLKQTLRAQNIQYVTVEYLRDLSGLASQARRKLEAAGEKVKFMHLNADAPSLPPELLILRLLKTGGLIIETYNNVAKIIDGSLQLNRPQSRLVYSSELDFEPNVDQFLATSVMRMARFNILPGKVIGSFIQGASFHCSETYERPLEKVAELLQAIKKLERYYINPVSDPYYHQLMEGFEQALHEKQF